MDAKLLVVDDEEMIVEVLIASLELKYPNIEFARNGAEAFDKISQNKYHAILSDIQMPKMTGLQLLKKLREEKNMTPFIVLTAFGDKEKAVEALRLGAFDFLDKPWKEEQLVDTVGRALELGYFMEKLSDTPENRKFLSDIQSETNKSSLAYLIKMINWKNDPSEKN